MEPDRRLFMRRVAAATVLGSGLASTKLLFAQQAASSSQKKCATGQQCPPLGPPPTPTGPSQAVADGAVNPMATAYKNYVNGVLSSADISAALNGVQTFNNYMLETGWTAYLQSEIDSNEGQFLNVLPSQADVVVQTYQSKLSSVGITTISTQDLQSIYLSLLYAPISDRQTAYTSFENFGGIQTSQSAFETRLSSTVTSMQAGHQITPYAAHPSGPFAECSNYGDMSALAGVLCSFGCAPCCVAAAVFFLEYLLCRGGFMS